MPAKTASLLITASLVAALAFFAAGCYPNPAPPNLTPIPTLAPEPTLVAVAAVTSAPTAAQAAAGAAHGDPQAGKALYAANCVACHGANEEGGVGPKLIGVSDRLTAQQLTDTITNGRKGTAMPAWGQSHGGKLTDAQIGDLIAFLGAGAAQPAAAAQPTAGATAQPAGAAQPAAGAAQGDPQAGKALYAADCVACHGANAEGGVGPKLIGVSARLNSQQLADTITNGRKGTAMPAWGQSSGGKLTDAQIGNLIAFLGTLK